MTYLSRYIFFVLWACSLGAAAQINEQVSNAGKVLLYPGESGAIPTSNIQYLVDKDEIYKTPNDLPLGRFRLVSSNKANPSLKNNPSPIWLKVILVNAERVANSWVFHVGNNLYADIYVDEGDGAVLKASISDHKVDVDYSEVSTGLSVAIDLLAEETVKLYIRLAPNQVVSPYFRVLDESVLSGRFIREHFVFSGFLFVLGTLCLVNIAQFLVLKRPAHIYYVIQEGCYLIVGLCLFGFGGRYIWIDTPYLDDNILISSLYASAAATLLFMRAFFETHIYTKRYDRFCLILVYVYLVLALISLFDTVYTGRVHRVASLGTCILAVVTGIYAYLKGNKTSLYYLLAYFSIALALFGVIAANLMGYTNIPIAEIMATSAVIEAILMFFALSLQLNQIRLSRDKQRLEMLSIYRERADESQALLIAERERLSLAYKYKEQLEHIASVGHDMSQSLQSLKMTVEAMKLMDKDSPYTGTLLESVNYLGRLTLDVVEDAKVEYYAQGQSLALAQIFKESVGVYQRAAEEKDIQLRYFDTGRRINASAVVLQRVVNNLVHNAISHTAGGKVLLGARAARGGVRVQVLDTGKGIASAQVQTLLLPFNTGSDDSRHQGLGLSIVKKLCEEAGWGFEIQSEPKVGSCFSIFIPA